MISRVVAIDAIPAREGLHHHVTSLAIPCQYELFAHGRPSALMLRARRLDIGARARDSWRQMLRGRTSLILSRESQLTKVALIVRQVERDRSETGSKPLGYASSCAKRA